MKRFLSALILSLLSLSPAAWAQSQSEGKNDKNLLEINVGSLLGDIGQYKESFQLLYGAIKELTLDPEKVTSYSAELPNKIHLGDELEFRVANVDDEATLVFDGVTQTLLLNQPEYRKVIKVQREGENLILFSLAQGLINPGSWHGDLMVRNLTTKEELIDHHPAGNDYLIPGRKRIYVFKFKAQKRCWFGF